MEDLEYLVKEHRELITIATEEKQDQIANYAQDRVLALEKHIWMYRSTLE
jgi:DNA-binding ferritin-like protein